MVFIGIKAGGDEVRVRVDDLENDERDLVTRTSKLVKGIVGRDDVEWLISLLSLIVVFFFVLIGSSLGSYKITSTALALSLSIVSALIAAVIVWVCANRIFYQNSVRDAAELMAHIARSRRSRELYEEFLAFASPLSVETLRKFVTYAEPA